MVLAGVALLVALAIGWLTGGSLERLGRVPLRSRRLVWAALAAQAAATVVGGPIYPVGLVVSALIAAAFLARNRGIRGTGLIALGLLSNALVVGLNGAMPVSQYAAGQAGVGTRHILSGDDPRHQLAGQHTRLPQLGDVIPVRTPWRPEVVSPGDVLIAAGLGQLVLIGMRTWRRSVRPVQRLPARPLAVQPCTPSTTRRTSWQSGAASAEAARRAPPTTATVPTRNSLRLRLRR